MKLHTSIVFDMADVSSDNLRRMIREAQQELARRESIDLDDDVLLLMAKGQIIDAIKIVRARSGLNLMQAKDIIEAARGKLGYR